MAVYGWIRGNAKIVGDDGDYLVRACDLELEKYEHILIALSDRMLSTRKRRKEAENQQCWFSGYLDKDMYIIATCAKQDQLLEIPLDGGGFRELYCVLVLGFTQNDIRLYKQDDSIFEPLKKIMREVNLKADTRLRIKCEIEQEFEFYIQDDEEYNEEEKYNIQKSTPLRDEYLWKQSLQRPVMTGIISLEDAKKLLDMFPNGIVTIIEDVNICYSNNQKKIKKLEQIQEKKEVSQIKKDRDFLDNNLRDFLDLGCITEKEIIDEFKETNANTLFRMNIITERELIDLIEKINMNDLFRMGVITKKERNNLMAKFTKLSMNDLTKMGLFKNFKKIQKIKKNDNELNRSFQSEIEDKQEQVKICSIKCREELSEKQVNYIIEIIKKMQLGSLSKQAEYFSYMYLWEKGDISETSIIHWVDTVGNEKRALEENYKFANRLMR